MKNIQRILVVIDPTVERDQVTARLNVILEHLKPEVRFFINSSNTLTQHSYAYEGMDGAFFEKQRQLFIEHYRKILDQLVVEFGGRNVKVGAAFSEEHHLAESIINQVRDFKPDLVLKSSHHHNLLQRSVISNTDWHLIRNCKAPLWMVKPTAWEDSGSVVAAVDPLHTKAQQSTVDRLLVSAATDLAADFDQTAKVFHCYFPYVSTLFPSIRESNDQMEEIRRRHEKAMQKLLAEYDIANQDVEIVKGDLVPALVHYLKQAKANVLVIGALSRNMLERAIVGNTAEKILDDCPCDVLIIKP